MSLVDKLIRCGKCDFCGSWINDYGRPSECVVTVTIEDRCCGEDELTICTHCKEKIYELYSERV